RFLFEAMKTAVSLRVIFSARHVRWLLLAVVCSVCVGLAVVTARNWKTEIVSLPTDGSLVSVQNFKTFLQQENMQMRISGDALVIAPIKLLGPFRLGLVHSLTIHNGTIETFPHPQSQDRLGMPPATFDRFFTSLPLALDRLVT